MLRNLILVALLLPFLINSPVKPENPGDGFWVDTACSHPETLETQIQVEAKTLDKRAKILSEYLKKYNSPLQFHAQDFIEASDTYQIDWRLAPSIAGVESTFGKAIPGGFNGWGWGVYGTQAIYFESWKDGIYTVSEGLKKNYIDKGLKDPHSMNRVYAASPYWGSKVNYFLNDLENFAQNFEIKEDQMLNPVNIEDKTAGASARLKDGVELAFKI